MQKCVIIINGIGGVGKDTLCDFSAKAYRVRNISSITPIKEIARVAGWQGEKDAKSRKLLSDLKRLFTDYNDLPMQYMLREYAAFCASDDTLLFVHIREPEEIERLRVRVTDCPCLTLLIRRTGLSGTSWGNASDDQVEGYAYSHVYLNDCPLSEAGADFVAFLSGITGIPPEKAWQKTANGPCVL